MSRIPQSFIDDLVNRVDIVDIIDSRVKLKKTGKNYSACCPFHDEKTPSFSVSPDKQFYHCFGCGASGNALSFLIEYERQSFVDAVENLAKTAGVDVPREKASPQAQAKQKKAKSLYEILEQAQTFYKDQLQSHPKRDKAVKYLKERGLSGAIARDFHLGLAVPGWDNLLIKLGTSDHDKHLLIDGGLAINKPEENKCYDRFRDRIMFPIRDSRGRTIGFGGRVLGDDKPKYLNSPETDIFHKGRELYGLYEARQHNNLEQLIVVEGYMDVIALAQYGLRNAVATLGTACGEDHLKLAFRFVKRICFCFDGDKAGRTAAKRALINCLPAMEDGREIRFLFLAEGQDPDSLVRQIGKERFEEQVNQSDTLEDYLFEVCAEGTDTSTMGGRATFSKAAAPLLNTLPNGVFRELMFEQLAKRTGLSLEVIITLTQAPSPVEQALKQQSNPHKTTLSNAPQPKPANDDKSTLSNSPYDNHHPEHSGHISYPEQSNDYDESHYPYHQNEPQQNNQPVILTTYQAIHGHTLTAQQPQRIRTTSISRAKRATTLLLEFPNLIKDVAQLPTQKATDDTDLRRLYHLIDHLKQRENATYSSILGFWGGKYGIDEQQKLANLISEELVSSAKSQSKFDPLEELSQCFNQLDQKDQRQRQKDELNQLKAKGLLNLNNDEKARLRHLTQIKPKN